VLAIRRATLDDHEPMTSVYTAAWRRGFQDMFTAGVFARDDFASDRAAECRAVLTHDATDTFVVECDQILIGFVAAHIQRSGAELEDIWLHPNSWGSGAGAALVSTIEEELRSIGGTRLTTWVPEDSPSGRRFFDKLGWRATGSTEPLRLYVDQPNRLFEYERILAAMDMTRGRPRPVVSLPF
jgi:GNAT superfamily N-acetyltransferase